MTTLSQLKELSNEELRVRVAECFGLGCQAFKEEYDEQHDRSSCQDYFTYYAIPNYPEDLNAIAEAEKTLSDEEYERYMTDVWNLVAPGELRQSCAPIRFERAYLSASARQRAIAFLAVRGSVSG